jgi:hypothetical protein
MNPNILTQMQAGCECKPTNFKQNGEAIEARVYDIDSVALARMAVMGAHPLLAGNYITTVDGVVDGKAYERNELKLRAKSKATGGRGKRECGFIPSDLEKRKIRKIQDTALLHIDHENCPYNFIGTEYQDIVFGQTREPQATLYGSDKIVMAAIKGMYDAMKTISVGIHGGSGLNTGHFDGVLAQIVRNDGGVYYETLKYDFAANTIDGTTPLYVKHGATKNTFTTIGAFADWVANIQDITGALVYTVLFDGSNVVQVTANKPAYVVGLEVVVDVENVDWTCAELFEPTTLQNRMPFPDSSAKIPFRPINATNFHDEMNLVMEAWEGQKQTQYESKNEPVYMGIDPLLLNVVQKQANFKLNTTAGGGQLQNPYQANNWYEWEFIPLEELRGSGLYWLTYSGNFHLLTDILRDGLSGLKVGVDEKCENVWMKFDQLANIIGLEFNDVVSNVCGSPFSEEVKETEPFRPENIPALCAETRETCIKVVSKDTANFTYDDADLENFAYESTTLAPYGLSITGYAWEIQGQGGSTAALPATQSGLADISNATLGFDAVALKLLVTFSDGSTDETIKIL